MAIKVKHVTSDGQEFDTLNLAASHETRLFELWIETDPKVDVIALLSLLDDHVDESYCSELTQGKSILRKYWDSLNAK